MRKIIYILTLATLLCSCSAEKQLARLLERHPELHTDTVYVIDTFFVLVPDTNTVRFTLDDLAALQAQLQEGQEQQDKQDSVALGTEDQNPFEANNSTQPQKPTQISAENKGSLASITPNADGSFNLHAITKPDTVYIKKKIPIPIYFTKTRDKIVYKMTNVQTSFFTIGIMAVILIVGVFILKIFNVYKK